MPTHTRGLITRLLYKGNSHDLQFKMCHISATLFFVFIIGEQRILLRLLGLEAENDEMTTKSKPGADYVSRNVVAFNGRKKGNNNNVTVPQYSSSALKAVPVAVLIAMSPLNSTSVASDYSRMNISPNVEEVSRSNLQAENEERIVEVQEIESENDYIRLLGISNDNDYINYEKMVFNYDFKTGDSVGWVQGKLVGICKERKEDGSRLIAYFPIDARGKMYNYKLAYMPRTIVPGVYAILGSKNHNNGAVGVLPKSEFVDYFGEDAVNNAPELKDQVMGYKDNFKYDF